MGRDFAPGKRCIRTWLVAASKLTWLAVALDDLMLYFLQSAGVKGFRADPYIYIYTYTYIYTYIYIHAYFHTYILTYILTYLHTYTHTHIHTYTHTHIDT